MKRSVRSTIVYTVCAHHACFVNVGPFQQFSVRRKYLSIKRDKKWNENETTDDGKQNFMHQGNTDDGIVVFHWNMSLTLLHYVYTRRGKTAITQHWRILCLFAHRWNWDHVFARLLWIYDVITCDVTAGATSKSPSGGGSSPTARLLQPCTRHVQAGQWWPPWLAAVSRPLPGVNRFRQLGSLSSCLGAISSLRPPSLVKSC